MKPVTTGFTSVYYTRVTFSVILHCVREQSTELKQDTHNTGQSSNLGLCVVQDWKHVDVYSALMPTSAMAVRQDLAEGA